MPRVVDEVWLEVLAAARWYEAQLDGLGERLTDEFDEVLARIDEHPHVGAP